MSQINAAKMSTKPVHCDHFDGRATLHATISCNSPKAFWVASEHILYEDESSPVIDHKNDRQTIKKSNFMAPEMFFMLKHKY